MGVSERAIRGTRLAALCAVCSLVATPSFVAAQADAAGPQQAMLRLAHDSAVVGHYRFSVQEREQMVFDIPADDPRTAMLEAATAPKQKNIDVAATLVSTPVDPEDERRYIAYWLGYRVSGDEVRGLSPLQWDSIFQKVGRRATLTLSPRGRLRRVEVGSDAVRPVGQALAGSLSALAMSLPEDSVRPGDRWDDEVILMLNAPDGSRFTATVPVRYQLREFVERSDGIYARVEFSGEPAGTAPNGEIRGQYYGDSLFFIAGGRYESIEAVADLEIMWEDSGGLPPSRSIVEWRALVTRR